MEQLLMQIKQLWNELESLEVQGSADEIKRIKELRVRSQCEFLRELIVDTADTVKILNVSNVRIAKLINEGRLHPIIRTRACTIFLRSEIENQAKTAAVYRQRQEAKLKGDGAPL